MLLPRFNLPEISFAEKSAAQIETDILNCYKTLTSQALGKADPRRFFLQAIIPILVQQRVLIDFSAKQNLLGYSTGDYLDQLGAFTNTTRLPATAAITTERFTLSIATQQTIPAGTRVTAGDGIFFATKEDVIVEAGQSYVDVEAECTQTGIAGNGYVSGELNQLVDPLQWVASVSNITESEGGVDEESDDSYAARIQQSSESFSVAGPTGAYQYWAKTASQSIVDVLIRSPSPGVIEIRPLLVGGEMPSQEILDLVLITCSDSKIRPLTDNVQVLAPEQVFYDISLIYWISSINSSTAGSIQSKVTQAIEDYKLWQKSKMGRAIDPSELITRIKNAGAKRVVVTFPVYQQISEYHVAKENLVTVIYGGLENN